MALSLELRKDPMQTHRKDTKKSYPPFDKYFYYSESVQSPDEDARFLKQVYKDARGKLPTTLREDFCGTFANSCSWVKQNPKGIAHGIDLDSEPIEYGMEHYFPKLSKPEQKRLFIHKADVLKKGLPKADIIAALNFSYFIFKERKVLLSYFKNCLAGLNPKGILVIDVFGGPKCTEPNEECVENGNPVFEYFWDQVSFEPLTNEAMFHIHFRRRGEPKRLNVFTYDWRMWSLPELKDLLIEAGFKKVEFLWEGATEEGFGDGDFKVVDKAEDCEAWVAYISAHK